MTSIVTRTTVEAVTGEESVIAIHDVIAAVVLIFVLLLREVCRVLDEPESMADLRALDAVVIPLLMGFVIAITGRFADLLL